MRPQRDSSCATDSPGVAAGTLVAAISIVTRRCLTDLARAPYVMSGQSSFWTGRLMADDRTLRLSKDHGMSTVQGRGVITLDGCPVEVYRRLPEQGEAAFISAAIQPKSLVLDLGAGTGRIADALVSLGHDVVAVDNSPDMLASVHRARPVLADIEGYRGDCRFDAVILASHLVNTPDARVRHALLRTVEQNLASTGTAFIEWHRPEWFDKLTPGQTYSGTVGDIISTLHVTSITDDILEATVTYVRDDERWQQTFTAQRLTSAGFQQDLRAAGLEVLDAKSLREDWMLVAPPQPS